MVSQALYNDDVSVLSPHRRMTRLLLAVLFGLLALGPFLHAHLGFSKITGFHVAGYDGMVNTSSPHSHTLDAPVLHPDLSDTESPAVGISSSLVRDLTDIPCPDGITMQSVVAIIACMLIGLTLGQPRTGPVASPARSRPGFPPPALAPPDFIA
jgi:hypothetical protein